MSERTIEIVDQEYREACRQLGHNEVLRMRLEGEKEVLTKRLESLLRETAELKKAS